MKWEYKIIRTSDGGLFSGDTGPMEGALNQLGDAEWELVATLSDGRSTAGANGATALVFKRPKPDA
ncbi:DUF4177 domain-containing protein [Halopelagius fulvigenes]|uniref:DUF4177 domain-containing protein n=1 Tax=Halopelagius fulvigenes TaxID=1198324 RepID=A0ABD5TWF1_9EURY